MTVGQGASGGRSGADGNVRQRHAAQAVNAAIDRGIIHCVARSCAKFAAVFPSILEKSYCFSGHSKERMMRTSFSLN
jgi:hypothetical protein